MSFECLKHMFRSKTSRGSGRRQIVVPGFETLTAWNVALWNNPYENWQYATFYSSMRTDGIENVVPYENSPHDKSDMHVEKMQTVLMKTAFHMI